MTPRNVPTTISSVLPNQNPNPEITSATIAELQPSRRMLRLDQNDQLRRHPMISSKTIVVPPTSKPYSELLKSKERASSVACLQDAKSIWREKLLRSLPNKLTTTGVRVFYLCDKPNEPEGHGSKICRVD